MISPPIAAANFAELLTPYMPVFYVSFLATLCLTPLMRILAHRHGVVDDPDGKRKVHTRPIAYLGGVSIFLGWLAGVSMAVFLRPGDSKIGVQFPLGIILGAFTVVFFGLMDDVFSIRPRIKLLGQLLAALFLIIPDALGSATLDFFLRHKSGTAWMIIEPLHRANLITDALYHEPGFHILAVYASALIAIFVIIAACNATNLLDGLDGLCSGVTGVMSFGYLILAVYLAGSTFGDQTVNQLANPTRIVLSLALLGAVMGFLPFNFNPASIFMGDTGSMFLGYICGTMILLFGQNGTVRWFLSAIIMFGLPMMDTLLAIVRRKLNRRRIFSADANHFHHFLIRRGFTVRQSVLISYTIAAIFVSFALVIVIIPTLLAIGVYLVLFGWIIVAAFKIGIVAENPTVTTNTTLNLSLTHPEAIATPPETVKSPTAPARPIPEPASKSAL